MRKGFATLILGGLLVSVGLALFLSPFASSLPDGLEWAAERLGFAHRDLGGLPQSPMPDYSLPGMEGGFLGTGLAGLVGTLVVFGVTLAIGYALRWKR